VAGDLGVRVASSLDDAVNAEDVDAVAICTSTDTHVDAMVAASAAGRAIFCEKPISLDLAEVDRGLNAVADAGVKLQIGFNRRFDPSHKAVADAVQHGAVGDVHLCSITSRDPGPPPIEYIRVSGGMFNDMTIHDFDMARYVTGSDVVEVYARGAVRVDPAIGEAGDIDTGVVLLTHANGALTTIDNRHMATTSASRHLAIWARQPRTTTTTSTACLPQRLGIGGRRSRTSSSSVMGRAISTSGLPSSTTCAATWRARPRAPTVEPHS